MASKKKQNDKDLHGEAEKSKIFSDVIIENNKRMLYAFLFIAGFANVAVTAIKAAKDMALKALEIGK